MIKKVKQTLTKIHAVVREVQKTHLRSPEWRTVRDAHLAEFGECAACGSKKSLQVHHIKPFHLHPELELESSNLITLCMEEWNCHLSLGHGGSFRSYNPNITSDASEFKRTPPVRKMIISDAKRMRRDA